MKQEKEIELGKGKKMKIVEHYGDKPLDEILFIFSQYILNFLGGKNV